jgi:hypothetical protein
MVILYLILGSVIGMGATAVVGFYKGYQICNQTHQARLLKAENLRLKATLNNTKILHEIAEAEVEVANRIDQENREVINDLKTQLEKASNGDCILAVHKHIYLIYRVILSQQEPLWQCLKVHIVLRNYFLKLSRVIDVTLELLKVVYLTTRNSSFFTMGREAARMLPGASQSPPQRGLPGRRG